MYAITCHKSQGLTLLAVVLHPSKEFVPGLTYVACTRVESCNHLQIVGFDRSHLLKPNKESVNICDGHCEPGTDTSCCRDHLLSEEDLSVLDADCLSGDDSEAFDGKEVHLEIERLIKSYFERGEPDDRALDLYTVFALLSEGGNDSVLKYPPPDFDLKAMLREMKIMEPLSEFAKVQNEELETLIHQNHSAQLMGQIMWCRAAQIVVEETICNPDELVISPKQWTADTRELYLLITRSSSFVRDLQLFFQTTTLTLNQTTIGAEIMMNVYKRVVGAVAAIVANKEASSPVNIDVKEMPIEGLAKVRHGGWAVKQVVTQKTKYAKENLFSLNRKTNKSACESHEMCFLFQDHIIENFRKP